MNSGKIFMSAVMLAIFVTMVGIATQYPPQARFMPLVVGIPGIALCLFQLILELRARRRPSTGGRTGSRSEFERAQDEVTAIVGRKLEFQVGDSELPKPGQARREVILWATFIGLVASLILFGFWLTIPVFLLLFLHWYGKESWRYSLLLSAVATGLLFLIFAKGLRVTLHTGFITEYVLNRLG